MTARIGTWEQLCAEARARWPLLVCTNEALVIGTAAASVTIARPVVSEPAFRDRSLVVIRVPLFGADRVAHQTALRLNDGLTIGALAIRDDVYELRRVVDLTLVSLPDLVRELRYLTKLGDAMCAEVVCDAPLEATLPCFDIYVD